MSSRQYSATGPAPPATERDWSAKQYAKFLDERTRPARELAARVPLTSPKRVIDLGCGPGNSTAVLVERYPDADISGVDSSADMLAKAKKTLPKLSFGLANLETYTPDDGPVDVFFSNAVFQWLPGQSRIQILTRLVEGLSPGGVLAFQVPNNLSEPSHVAMRDTAAAPNTPWTEKLAHLKKGRDEFPQPTELHDALSPLCSDIDIWETKYFHTMESHEAIVEWVKGTGLRPFLNALSDTEQEGFVREYLARLKEKYPTQRNGTVLLPYPRLFVVATKA
ncbi:related to trans-aconitate 2-methyltransferase [Cephalotrichum gorgonifer]|uniref:Related to trans-aconitate 2-methyltransferase n=1 Tax=Cephalotrichum gorgonifer TaxID=2041049 RepID=A0AAE8N716_9PEZI|nr:related to trans-aconitate 2-methyltransferase [Cephalotrichum gorgonifer]